MNKNIIQKKMMNSIHLKETIDGVAEKSISSNLRDYQILGNTVQNGEPTVENPVEVVSVGELVTDGKNVGKYEIPIKISGLNIFDNIRKNTLTVYNGITQTIDKKGIVTLNGTSTKTCYPQYANSFFLPKGKYTLYANITGDSTFSIYVQEIDSGNSKTLCSTNGSIGTTFTTTQDWNVICYIYVKGAGASFNNVKYKPMLVRGYITNLEFEPAQEILNEYIYLSEPLRKIGDAQDYIDFRNQKVYRNVRKLALTGEEKFVAVSTTTKNKFYRFQMTNEHLSPSSFSDWSTQKCNYFTGANITTTNTNVGILVYFSVANSYTYCQVRDNDNFPTVDDFLAFLKEKYAEGNPLVIYYQSYDTIEEDIELPKLPQYKGTTIYQIATNIPSEFVGTYKTRL